MSVRRGVLLFFCISVFAVGVYAYSTNPKRNNQKRPVVDLRPGYNEPIRKGNFFYNEQDKSWLHFYVTYAPAEQAEPVFRKYAARMLEEAKFDETDVEVFLIECFGIDDEPKENEKHAYDFTVGKQVIAECRYRAANDETTYIRHRPDPIKRRYIPEP